MAATTFVPQSIYATHAGLIGASVQGRCSTLTAKNARKLLQLDNSDSTAFVDMTVDNLLAKMGVLPAEIQPGINYLVDIGAVGRRFKTGYFSAGIDAEGSSNFGTITTTGDIVTPGTAITFANTGLRAGGIAIGRGASGVAGEQLNLWSNGVNKIALVGPQGLNLANDRRIRLSSTASSPGTMDASIGRASTGMVDILADNGLTVRNLANTADAPITAGFVISPTIQYGSGNQRIKGSPNAVTVRNSIDNANGALEASMLIGDGNTGYAISTAHGLVAASNKLIGFSNSISGQGTRDTIATRNASGPKWTFQSDGGVEIRNLANTADAPITCGALNPNGDLTFATTNPVVRAGSTILFNNNVFFSSATHAASRAAASSGFIVGSIYNFRFSSTTGANGVADTALSRQSAGVIEVNNGTSGQLRDMAMRAIGLWSSTPPASQPAAIPDATDLASALTSLNSLLAAVRSYGLISS